MKVFETFRVEVIDDGHSGADQQRCAQEQDRNPLLPVEVNQDKSPILSGAT
jgi:hypothetical protein